MKYATIGARILLGLAFFVFGLNGFLGFIPPPAMEGTAKEFMNALFQSNFLYVIKVLEISGGLLLLVGKKIPLGLVILTPIIVNIFLFHLLMDPSGMIMAIILIVLNLFLIFSQWETFSKVLEA